MRHSLLDDPLIRVLDGKDQASGRSLPEILTALARDDVRAFEALQPHQQQAWYSFLVQLAAMGVARQRGGELPDDAAGYREMLVGLADGSEAAWHLVVEDVLEPAFMQPPVPEGSLGDAGYRSDIQTPDDIDVLVTSKNHDVKRNRVRRPRPQHWLFALVNLQTMEGFLGRGNYGIVRMNGGFGNRASIGLAAGLSWSSRFLRDLEVLKSERHRFSEQYDLNGHRLLWVNPWDGARQSGIPLRSCDPYFLEVCRRIRLTGCDGEISCWRSNTQGQRITPPEEYNGNTGDPWSPIEKAGAKVLTVGEAGFTYDLLQQILLGEEYLRPITLEFQESEREGAFFIARTLVRGQGRTEGLHRRVVPVPRDVAGRLFSEPSEREKLARRAKQRVDLAATVQKKILFPAMAALLSSGRDGAVDWSKVRPWTDAFDRAVDARFFESLWASIELDEEGARRLWDRLLFEEAEAQFKDAEGGTPVSAIHRWRAISKARSIFYGRAQAILEYAFASKDAAATSREDSTT